MRYRYAALSALLVVGLLGVSNTSPLAAEAEEAPENLPIQQLQQDPREALKNWKPDEPFDLTGDVPDAGEVRAAVFRAMDFVLDQQEADGSWDVDLSGAILSGTADDAVDAVTATSMSCLGLRNFADFNPKRAEPAIRRGADFVMEQVLRGKLSTKVWYAIWRYSFGIRFLMGEYRLTEDEIYKARLRGVCRRMMDSILSMQKSNDEAKAFLKSSRRGEEGYSTRSGIRVAPPGIDDITGGAIVIFVEPESSGAAVGVKPGDRIIEVGKTPIGNGYDFVLEESDFIEGDRIDLKVLRASESEKPISIKMPLLEKWPPDLGLRLTQTEAGLEVSGFWPGSEARDKGIERGAIILKVNNKDVTTLEEVEAAMAGKKIGDRVSIRSSLEGKKSSTSVTMAARHPGWAGIYPDDENKGVGGVLIQRLQNSGAASKAELKTQDQITHINNIPVMGLDHYNALMATFWEGQTISLGVTRMVEVDANGKPISDEDKKKRDEIAKINGEELPEPILVAERFNKDLRLSAYLRRGDLQFSMKARRGTYSVDGVLKGGIAEKKGVKEGDELVSINGEDIRNDEDYKRLMGSLFVGDEATFIFRRGNGKIKVVMPVLDAPPTINDEEGGWAYYFEKPHAPSFVTSAVILNIMEYDETFGKVSRRQDKERKHALDAATDALMDLRVYDKANKVYSYVYDIRGVKSEMWIDIHGNVGRIMVGELAAHQRKKISTAKLQNALDGFFDFREELDKVRSYPHTHYSQRFNNAAYYWLFGHYYAALAAQQLSTSKRDKAHEQILKAVMLKRNPDGTWLGHEGFGKLCGTTHAMLILGQLKHMPWGQLPSANQE